MKKIKFQAVLVSLSRLVLNTTHRMVYPFLAVFGRGLGVSLEDLSLAITGRSIIGATGPLFASIADNRSRKAGMLFGFILFVIGAGVVAIWPSYPSFILALVLTLMGKYVFDPAMQAYFGDQVPYKERGKFIAVTELSWSLSFIVGVPLIGLLIARQTWVAPFPILAFLGSIAFFVLAIFLPASEPPAEKSPSLWRNLANVVAYPPAWIGLSFGFLISAANEVVNLIFGVWMEDAFNIQIAALGATAAAIGFAELGGESLSGLLSDRLGKISTIRYGTILNCLAALALPVLGRSTAGAIFGLILFYITFEFTLVSSIPLMTEIQPKARATLMSVNVSGLSLGRSLGAFLAPRLFEYGVLYNGLVAVAFNLLALFALHHLNKNIQVHPSAE